MSEESLNETLAAVETALTQLPLNPTRVDRDRVMYLAGQAAAIRRSRAGHGRWLWPLVAAASLLVAAVLGGLRLAQPERPADRVADTPVAPSETPSVPTPLPQTSPQTEGLVLDQLMRRQGIETSPPAPSDNSPPERSLTPRDVYRAWVESDQSG